MNPTQVINMALVVLFVLVLLSLGYLGLISPRIFHRPRREQFKRWLYAHRGLHDNAADAPENSMAAFAKAVEAGYGIELDIQLSKDKVPVVFHDFTLQRACGVKGKVSDYTYEELQEFRLFKSRERIPKFEDVLELVDGKVPLIVEFKIEFKDLSLCPIADNLLRRYSGLYCMESFNPLGVWWYRRHRRDVMRGQLSDAFLREGRYRGPLYFALQNLLANFISRPDFIAYPSKYPRTLSRKICCGPLGAMGAAWTVKSQAELDRAGRDFDIFIFEGFRPNAHSHGAA
ncbi:MAG: glycerophosphodiester phosphodiesterase [Clostridium sp.]|nr:glycerophosphodiester phosphodiesterase [Acetatifactor muris]MCM1527405.1 hypothetical protein [Bacteroides sp.]MCM1563531.1 glycerophosphodiester phosphodiesterase [Clostridium sp.]